MKTLGQLQESANKWSAKEYGGPDDIGLRLEVIGDKLEKARSLINRPDHAKLHFVDAFILILDVAKKIGLSGDGLHDHAELRLKWLREIQTQRERTGVQ